mgnify:CR=1 FL=1
MTRPQIRYWTDSQSQHDDSSWNPDGHTINLLIVNREDKIPGILQKLYEQLAPVQSKLQRTSGRIQNSELSYQFHTIHARNSHPDDIKWPSIFRGKITKDRELRERSKKDTLEIYVDSHIQQLSS